MVALFCLLVCPEMRDMFCKREKRARGSATAAHMPVCEAASIHSSLALHPPLGPRGCSASHAPRVSDPPFARLMAFLFLFILLSPEMLHFIRRSSLTKRPVLLPPCVHPGQCSSMSAGAADQARRVGHTHTSDWRRRRQEAVRGERRKFYSFNYFHWQLLHDAA